MAHGHGDAWSYSIGHIYQEAALVIARVEGERARTAELMKLAMSSVPNMVVKPESTRKLGDLFAKAISAMKGE